MTPDPRYNPHREPTLLHWIEYGALKAIAFIARHGNPRVVDGLSAALWRWAAPKFWRQKRADRNLAQAIPNLSIDERQKILIKMWDNLGRTTTEAFALAQIADNPQAVTFNFSDDVMSIMKSDRSAIFVGLHAGNWEIPALAAERFGKPLMGIYQRILNPLVDREVVKLRSRFYRGGLYAKARETVTQIRRGLSDGYSVAIMADLRDSYGEFVPFFGILARSTSFPVLLARLHKVPVIAIRAVRVGVRRFRVDAVLIDLASGVDRKEVIHENTARIQKQFEKWIREDPSQWMWGHNRWDTKK
jgi:KDO2-lipid IV(A) lauroyltransferase